MFNVVKKVVGIVALVVVGAIFLVLPASANSNDVNANNQADGKGQMKTDGEARGVANFTMSFSGSGTTKGNFDADAKGMTQNMFYGEDRPYYYQGK